MDAVEGEPMTTEHETETLAILMDATAIAASMLASAAYRLAQRDVHLAVLATGGVVDEDAGDLGRAKLAAREAGNAAVACRSAASRAWREVSP